MLLSLVVVNLCNAEKVEKRRNSDLLTCHVNDTNSDVTANQAGINGAPWLTGSVVSESLTQHPHTAGCD